MPHPAQTFQFTAFDLSDLSDGPLGHGDSFTQPGGASVTVSVTDNDGFLSGDFRDHARDRNGQDADITRFGEEAGNGGQIYAERALTLHGDDGRTYFLVEIEQEGSDLAIYTYFGHAPDAGVELTVGASIDVRVSLPYDFLDGGDPVPNIVAIAQGSDDFNLLVRALGVAGLAETVQNATDITVFAPTDAAFTQLAVDLGFTGDTSDEDAVFDALVAALTELGGGDPIPVLTDVLLYHVSGGAQTEAEIAATGTIDTLLDGATFVSEDGELVDNEPDIENPEIVAGDIVAENGIIQVIDRVLIPLDIPGNETPEPEPEPEPTLTLAGIVEQSGGTFDDLGTDFDLLLTSLQVTGLDVPLSDPDALLTVFAPNDDAFVGLAQTLGFEGTDEGEAFGFLVEALTLLSAGGDPIPLLTDVLLFHVAPGALDATAVLGSESIPTLLGVDLTVDGAMLVDQDPDIPDPSIIATDIPATNGIAHVLDGVLLPADLLQSDGSNDVDFLVLGDGNDTARTGLDNDFVSGGAGNDRIILNRGDDVGLGGAGNDVLRGDGGNDILDGGAGRDLLVGGGQADTLTGGEGADTFVFHGSAGSDVITDFEVGIDIISLRSTPFDDFHDIEHLITDGEDGAVIDLDRVDITLRGITADDLSADDFVFL